MDIKQYITRVSALAQAASKETTLAIRVPAANKMRATIINRIANEGRATDGSKIGAYSRKPGYYTQKQFVRRGAFQAVGKSGKATFADGRPHRSMYLQGGYGQLRDIQGRRTDVMNLQYSGDMLLDFQQQATDTAILIGFTKKKESDKRKGNEQRAGKKIFQASQTELAAYHKECAQGYAELSAKTLRG